LSWFFVHNKVENGSYDHTKPIETVSSWLKCMI
jgi:hypothetical protein